MATSSNPQDREQFYQTVRQRTVESWRKAYITNPDEEKKTQEIVENLRTKPESAYSINNVLWVVASIGVFYFTDFALVVLYDKRVYRIWMQAGAACMLVAVLCCLYCVIWLSKVKGIKSDKWEEHNIFVIPMATVAAIVGIILVCYGLWPVWSVLTIPIVGTMFMGFVVFVAMLPDVF